MRKIIACLMMVALLAAAYPAWAQTVSQPGVIQVDIPEGLIWFSRQMHDVKELGLEGFNQEKVDVIFQSDPRLQIYILSPKPDFEIVIEFKPASANQPIPQGIDKYWLKTMLPALQEEVSTLPEVLLEDGVKIASFPNADFVTFKTKVRGVYTRQYMTFGNSGHYQIILKANTPITPEQEALLSSLMASAVFTVPTERISVALPVSATLGKGEWRFSIPGDWRDMSYAAEGLYENEKLYGDTLGTMMFVSWEDRWPKMTDEAKALYEGDPRAADIPGSIAIPFLYPQDAMPEDWSMDLFEVGGVSYGLVLWEEKSKDNGTSDENSNASPHIDCIAMVDGVLYGYYFSGAWDMPTLRSQMEDILNTVVYPAW